MPTLIKDGAIAADSWATSAETEDGQRPLLPPDTWRATEGGAALLLDGDAEPHDDFAHAPLIAIHFPEFKDGRGLSLATLLRTRHGFTGDLRAIGDVQPDLVHYLMRCGFTSFVLPDGKDTAVALRSVNVHRHYYQGSVTDPTPLFRSVARG
ncbi:MAG: DUF934 domain-containing protein [Pseudomonadales bacterium]